MGRGLWVDVTESSDKLILVNDVGGDVPTDYFAKNCTHFSRIYFSVILE